MPSREKASGISYRGTNGVSIWRRLKFSHLYAVNNILTINLRKCNRYKFKMTKLEMSF